MEKNNEEEKTFRRALRSKNKTCYYIINELVDGENTKIFSAARFSLVEGEKRFEDDRFCIKYISKDWIRKEIFGKLQISGDREIKFFNSLHSSCEQFKNLKHINIQKLIDYIDDDKGIYIVLEFCDFTLKDYVQMTREPVKNVRFPPFEMKVRKVITQILETVNFMHSKSMYFGGMLNSSDIMIKEDESSKFSLDYKKSANTIVKFPNPFLCELFTILKLYNIESFPSYYAPEIFKLFEEKEIERAIEKKNSFDLSNLQNKINQNMDMWSLGYLIYEILFEDPPFSFSDLSSALNSLFSSFTYEIYPYKISSKVLEVITRCLQLNSQERIDSAYLDDIKKELMKENENMEEVEKMMKRRMKDLDMCDDPFRFDLISNNNYDKY
jgi:serine/threonine protein kinase